MNSQETELTASQDVQLKKYQKKASKFDHAKLKELLISAMNKIKNNKHVKRAIDEIKTMIQMLALSLSGKSNFKLTAKESLIIAGALLYFVVPIDAIPDFLGAVGYTDDVSLLFYAYKQLTGAVERFKLMKEVEVDVESI